MKSSFMKKYGKAILKGFAKFAVMFAVGAAAEHAIIWALTTATGVAGIIFVSVCAIVGAVILFEEDVTEKTLADIVCEIAGLVASIALGVVGLHWVAKTIAQAVKNLLSVKEAVEQVNDLREEPWKRELCAIATVVGMLFIHRFDKAPELDDKAHDMFGAQYVIEYVLTEEETIKLHAVKDNLKDVEFVA